MSVKIEKIGGTHRKSIPGIHETIYDDFDIPIDHIKSVMVYFRDKNRCPFNRGNWIIDIEYIDGSIFCIKLPKEMAEVHVINWAKPLFDDLNKRDLLNKKQTPSIGEKTH